MSSRWFLSLPPLFDSKGSAGATLVVSMYQLQDKCSPNLTLLKLYQDIHFVKVLPINSPD